MRKEILLKLILTVLTLGLITSLILPALPVGAQELVSPGTELEGLRGRAHRVYQGETPTTFVAEFTGSPEFTRSIEDNSWIEYGFSDYGDFYSVQHPWWSVAFYDYYTTVYDETFTEVKIYDDRWTVEYLNKQGKWTDSSFWGVVRSYEIVADGVKLKRTGSTVIGQREEIYYFRNGSPCKIEIRQTCDEAQNIRFVWKPTGIVADTENQIIPDESNKHAGKTSGLNYYDSTGKFVQTMRWYDELDICNEVTPVVEASAQGRKATVTFGTFSTNAGSIAVLDPDTFYPDADPETSSVDGRLTHSQDPSTWAAIRGGAGTAFNDSDSELVNKIKTSDITDNYRYYNWIAVLYNTEPLPDGAAITAATLSLYGFNKNNDQSINLDYNIYACNPASTIVLEAGDYDTRSYTPFSTAVDYNNWPTSGYVNFPFNTAGKNSVSRTGVSKYALLEVNYDVGGATPFWADADHGNYSVRAYSSEQGDGYKPVLVVTYQSLPTVTTQAASSIEDTTATGNGNITSTGNGDCDIRGIVWDLATQGAPGNVAPDASGYANDVDEVGSFSTGAFTRSLVSLPTGDTIYARAYTHNTSGYAYGDEVSFLTKPAAPTDVAATDGTDTTKVVITWTKSTGATGYKIYEDSNLLDTLGDVATFDDTTALAGTIDNAGTADASDGTEAAHVVLALAGESTANGASRTYKVVALNATGDSDDSTTDTGYRGVGAITYQWQRSSADSDADYSNIPGGTTDPYNDTTAPIDGSGRYFRCTVSSTDASNSPQTSTSDRGYRFVTLAVVTQPCTGFSKVWAIVNGEIVTGSDPITEVGFEYGLTTSYGSNWTATGNWTKGDEFWAKLSPLSPATLFHYRAMAYAGSWNYGNDRVFSTVGSAVLYETLNTGGDGDSDPIYSSNWTVEQFSSDNISHTVTSVRVPLKRVGDLPGNVSLSITHADSDNFSTGADLTIAYLNGNAMTTNYVWYDFDVPDISFDESSSYAVVIRALSGNSTDYILWQKDSGGALDNAVGSHSIDSGINWLSDAPADYLFEVWGETVFSIEGAQVFSTYVEEGDWLITLTYKNNYIPYYPNEDPAAYFYIQLVDDTTVKAQVNCSAWGYKPGSIYISKSLADTLEWGAAYKIRLRGDFGIYPVTDYVLTALDWRGTELSFLDRWVIAQANSIGDYYDIVLTVDIADLGEVLNAAGHTMFTIGIPELNVVRPDLFEMVVRQPGYIETTWTHLLPSETDWEVRLGPQVSGILTEIGALINVDGKGVGGALIFVAFMIVLCLLTLFGNLIVGLSLGYPILLAGAWFGVVDYILLGVLTFAVAVVFVYKVFLIR